MLTIHPQTFGELEVTVDHGAFGDQALDGWLLFFVEHERACAVLTWGARL